MSEPAAATVSSTRNQREQTVPVVTVESFYNSHAEKLHMKLEEPRVGFHRKIREPTINRPGLPLVPPRSSAPGSGGGRKDRDFSDADDHNEVHQRGDDRA